MTSTGKHVAKYDPFAVKPFHTPAGRHVATPVTTGFNVFDPEERKVVQAEDRTLAKA